jgi:hypothetical protein
MIAEIFALLFLNSIYIIGLHNAARFEYVTSDAPEYGIIENSKMILWRVRLFCLKTFGKFYSKGLITCPPCMAGVHSTYFYWLIVCFYCGYSSISALILYPLYVGALSGLIYVMVSVIEMIQAITDKMYS